MNYIYLSWLSLKIGTNHILNKCKKSCRCKRRKKKFINDPISADRETNLPFIYTNANLPCVCSEYYNIIESDIRYIQSQYINKHVSLDFVLENEKLIYDKLNEFERDYKYIISMCSACCYNINEKYIRDYEKIKEVSKL